MLKDFKSTLATAIFLKKDKTVGNIQYVLNLIPGTNNNRKELDHINFSITYCVFVVLYGLCTL